MNQSADMSQEQALPAAARWGWLILLGVMVLVYSGALRAGFFLDDTEMILFNPAITDLAAAFKSAFTVDRGLVKLSFALNYAIGGTEPWGYHLVNLLVHYLNGLLLWGLLYTTLQLPRVGMPKVRAARLALAGAAVWLVHPLGSQAVIYTVQRAELMATTMILFCAFSLLQSQVNPSRRRLWQTLCVLGSFVGMQCKLIAIVIPLLLLVFDWLLLGAHRREFCHKRRWLYVGVFASWCMLFVVGALGILESDAQVSSAGTGLMQAIPPLLYLAVQSQVLFYYLAVSVWPQTLVFDHAWPLPIHWTACWPTLLGMTVLFALTVWLVIKRVRWAMLPSLFFLVLAPTSSFMPVIDLAVEHRMYLALASVCIAVVLLLGSLMREKTTLLTTVLVMLITALSMRTWVRVGDYQQPQLLWGKVLTVYPDSKRAYAQVRYAKLIKQGLGQQIQQLQQAVAQDPNDHHALYALGEIFFQMSNYKLARPMLEQAWERKPDEPAYLQALARMLRIDGDLDRARELYEKLVAIQPDDVPTRLAVAELLAGIKQWDQALTHLQHAQRVMPDNPSIYANMSNVLLRADRAPQAIAPARRAYELAGEQSANAAGVLASAYAANGMWSEAAALFEQVLQLKPQDPGTIQRLAWLYATCPDPAVVDGEKAVTYARQFYERIGGASPTTWDTLAAAWARVGQFNSAVDAMHKAIERLKTVGRDDLIPAFEQRLQSYQDGRPFTQDVARRQ
ncbi:MAG: tetratricopeptide repeat protein [Phycisphaeraceae bacterium JB051]